MRLVIGRLGFAEVVEMTADAFRRQTLAVKRPHRAHLVAGIAIDRGMRADQRKSVLVLTDVVNGNLPAGVAVAQIALRAIFPPMNVSVAVLALLAHIGEDQVGVAIRATYLHVHAAQRKSRLFMLEFWNRPDRRPALLGMTILARNFQGAMRAMGAPICGGRLFISCCQPDLKK